MSQKKVLIVDDEAEIRNIVSTFLSKKGFETVAVESGVLALSLLGKERFDVLVSDINMPAMDGVEFSRRAKKFNPRLAVILLTGYGSLETAQESIRIGVADYMTKPVDLEKLLESVNSCIKRIEEEKTGDSYKEELEKDLEADKKKFEDMKDEVMLLIGHELNTPISIISAGLSYITDKIDSSGKGRKSDAQTQKRILNSVENGRRRLITIVEDIVSYMNLARGKARIEKKEVVLNTLLTANSEGLNHVVTDGNGVLQFEIAKEDIEVIVDQDHFLDVVTRLVHNTVFHNREKVNVRLSLSSIMKEDKKYARIEIRDDGKGMDEGILKNIFEPFNVSDIMHHTKGLGLSMAMCKVIVESHDGAIRVESRKDKGVTVMIDVPQNN